MDAAGSRRSGVKSAPPAGLLNSAQEALGTALEVTDQVSELRKRAGAYIVLVHLPSQLTLNIPRFVEREIEAGWYVYGGSARGPGGVAARVRRHLRADKVLRWHVDHITIAADVLLAASISGLTECEIAEALGRAPSFAYPLEGFGSSDCRTCRAHLLQYSRTML